MYKVECHILTPTQHNSQMAVLIKDAERSPQIIQLTHDQLRCIPTSHIPHVSQHVVPIEWLVLTEHWKQQRQPAILDNNLIPLENITILMSNNSSNMRINE